jgi:hypothetical protein
MSNFPASVYSPRIKSNKVGVTYDSTKATVGYAEDVSLLDAEVVAIENLFGKNEDTQTIPVTGAVLKGKADGKSKWSTELFIGATGNVGIGTTNPSFKLEVTGSNSASTIYPFSVTNPNNQAGDGGGAGIKFSTSDPAGGGGEANKWSSIEAFDVNNYGSNSGLSFTTSLGYTKTKSMVINRSGNVGIGTTAPTNILSLGNSAARKFWIENTATDVVGRALTVAAGGTVAGTAVSDVVGGNLILQSGLGTGTGNSSISFQTGTTLGTGMTLQTMSTKMTILGNGNVGIGTTSPSATLSVAGSIRATDYFVLTSIGGFRNNTGFEVYGATSDGLQLNGAAGGNHVRITSTGNVGIGTSAPGGRLDVKGSGNTSATYGFNVQNSDGTGLVRVLNDGNVGIGTTEPTNILSLGNSAARKFWIENTATDVVGRALTVAAGGTVAGTAVSDVVGGNLILQSGLGTGTGNSSISFQTGTTLGTGMTLQTMSTKMTILGNGNVGIGTTSPTISDGTGLHIAGKIVRIGTTKTPATSDATGNVGEICWDSDYIYVCIATNTWVRAALATW